MFKKIGKLLGGAALIAGGAFLVGFPGYLAYSVLSTMPTDMFLSAIIPAGLAVAGFAIDGIFGVMMGAELIYETLTTNDDPVTRHDPRNNDHGNVDHIQQRQDEARTLTQNIRNNANTSSLTADRVRRRVSSSRARLTETHATLYPSPRAPLDDNAGQHDDVANANTNTARAVSGLKRQ